MNVHMSKTVEITRARLDDRHEICRVQKSSITVLCGEHYTLEEIEAWVEPKQPDDYLRAIEKEIVLVAKIKNRIVGFAQMTREDARINALYIDPEHIRSGIGTRLLGILEDEARKLGRETVNLEVPLNAVSFCLARGFASQGQATRSVRSGVVVPCVHMQKRLNPGA